MKDITKLLDIAIEAALRAGEKTLKFYHEDYDVIVKDDNSPLTLADLEANQVIMDHLRPTSIPILSEENKVVPYEERKEWKMFWLVDPLDGTKEFINKRTDYTVNIALISKGEPILGVVYAPVLDVIYYGTAKTGSFKAKAKKTSTIKDIYKKAVLLSIGDLPKKINVIGSRSHLSDDTKEFIAELEKFVQVKGFESYGSSLKLCMIAEGAAEIYPRLGPTMEWDTAASHAVVRFAGGSVLETETAGSLKYNKENLLNPYFIVSNPKLEKTILKILNKA